MSDSALTPQRILEATEEVLRRYGPAKTTVVDVARALGVSHGSVYRHFPSKAALREAITETWLGRIAAPLGAIAAENAPALDRLRRWLDYLIQAKRQLSTQDPELFANYLELAAEAREVVLAHVETLVQQLNQIISEGMAQREFRVSDAARTARAIFDATGRFHNPAHAQEWRDPQIDAAFAGVWALILDGLL